MFTSFKKVAVRKDNLDNELRFQLSAEVEVLINLNEPPFYSRAYLCVNGENVSNVSISPEKIKALQTYFDGVEASDMSTNALLLEELKALELTTFVDEIEKYQDRSSAKGNSL